MARPRKATDEAVFEAVHRLMNRLGPTQWTLADVAAEVGLTASALVQRFGSKRELQIAFMEKWGESAPDLFDALRSRAATPLAAVYAYADFFAELGRTPGGLAHHLAYLQLDLSEPLMHRALQRQARESRESLRVLLEEAVAAGELRSPGLDPAELARLVEVVVTGSLLVWGIHQDGEAGTALRRDVTAVLRPWLVKGLDPDAA
jgi:AcrR family transcriptional regulator